MVGWGENLIVIVVPIFFDIGFDFADIIFDSLDRLRMKALLCIEFCLGGALDVQFFGMLFL